MRIWPLLVLTCSTAAAQTVEVVSRIDPPSQTGTGGALEQVVISSDGSTVVTLTDSAIVLDRAAGFELFAYDVEQDALTLLARGFAQPRATSADGRYVVVDSLSLVAGAQWAQVVRLDRATGAVMLVSHSAAGPSVPGDRPSSAVATSDDGRFILYNSYASNLVPGQVDPTFNTQDVFLFDAATGQNTLISGVGQQAYSYASSGESLSPDGRWVGFVAFLPPMAITSRAYLWDRLSGTSVIASGGGLATGARVSADGAWMAFESNAPSPIARAIYLFERATGLVSLVSRASGSPTTPPNGASTNARISADGSRVVFASLGTDVVPGQVDTNGGADVFVFDRIAGTTQLLSRSAGSAATTGNGAAIPFSLLLAGGRASFESAATDLVAGQADANGESDLFAADIVSGATELLSHRAGSAVATGDRGVSSSALFVASALSKIGNAAFLSAASDLTAGLDRNAAMDPFVHVPPTGTRQVLPQDPAQLRRTGNGKSEGQSLSADGRYLAFNSGATDLVPGQVDDPNTMDAFLFDRTLGTVTLVSHSASSRTTAVGGGVSSISADGRLVLYGSLSTAIVPGQIDTNESYDSFLFDRLSGESTLVSHVPGSSVTTADNDSGGTMTADGSYVAITSWADNLVAGQSGPLFTLDVFLYERATGAITLLSHPPGSSTQTVEGHSIAGGWSDDGRFLVFDSVSANLVPGQVDTNNTWDVFLFDRLTGETSLASHRAGSSVASGSGPSEKGQPSADGARVVFVSSATDLVQGSTDVNDAGDVFLLERRTGVITLVSHAAGAPLVTANGWSSYQVLSHDGTRIAYGSEATNLVAGQIDANGGSDLFLYDPASGTNRLVSHAAGSTVTAANDTTPAPFVDGWLALSGDGRRVAFVTKATDVVPNSSPLPSTYLFDAEADSVELVSRTPLGTQGNGAYTRNIGMSRNGNFVAFADLAPDLVAGDFNGTFDVFLFGPVHFSTNLRVTLVDSADPIATGQPFTYVATVANTSRTDATATLVVDLPAGVSFQGSTPGPPVCVASGPVVTCQLGTIDAGGMVAVSLDVTATLTTGVLTCRARAIAVEPDIDPTDDVAVETTTVDPADVAVALAGPAGPVPPDTPYPYTLTVTNQGPSSATALTLVDTLSPGLSFVSSTPGPPVCTHLAQVVTCDLGTVAPSAAEQVTVQVQPGGYTSVSTEASVSATSHDPVSANNVASLVTLVAMGSGAELGHGTVMTRDLAPLPGPTARADRFRLVRPARTSWEVVVDGASGDLAGPVASIALERLASDLSTVLQAGLAVGTGNAVGLAMENASAASLDDEGIRVRSTGCTTDCGMDDTYRIRVRETTALIPRFNNSASQVTVVLLQNREARPVSGHVWFWSASGSLRASRNFTLAARASLTLLTTSVPGLTGASGSITVSHDGPYDALAGKAVALEPATGFAFDSPLQSRPR